MPPMLKIFETVFYSLISFLPYILLAMYPFREMLRFSNKVTLCLIGLVTFVQIILGILANFYVGKNVGLLSVISTLIYGVFYFFAIKANLGKTLFTLLMVSNIANFVVMSSKCLEGVFFPELARQNYRWSFSLMTFLLEILVFIPLLLYMKNVYSKAMEEKSNIKQWRFLWLIPATFYLLWYHNTYFNSMSALEIALRPSNAVFLLFINLGSLFVYNVVVQTVNAYSNNLILQAQNHRLTMQSLQYENLRERINEARREKHDFRHHIALMTGYLDNGDFDNLKNYLHSFMRALPEDCNIIFCEHYALNILLVYYSQLSKQNGINFSVEISVPAEIKVSDSDVSVLIGNILENAIDACSVQKSKERKIIMHGCIKNSCLLFTIDNTYENDIRKDADGVYSSTKHCGNGIGIESAKAIVERYKGIMRTEQKNGFFYVSVMLNL